MIDSSRELFDFFAEYCAEQSIAGRGNRPTTAAAPAPSGDQEAAPSPQPTSNAVETKPSGAVAAKYNYPALLQRVLMLLRESRRSVLSAEKIHDVAMVLDRCKRQKGVENARWTHCWTKCGR